MQYTWKRQVTYIYHKYHKLNNTLPSCSTHICIIHYFQYLCYTKYSLNQTVKWVLMYSLQAFRRSFVHLVTISHEIIYRNVWFTGHTTNVIFYYTPEFFTVSIFLSLNTFCESAYGSCCKRWIVFVICLYLLWLKLHKGTFCKIRCHE